VETHPERYERRDPNHPSYARIRVVTGRILTQTWRSVRVRFHQASDAVEAADKEDWKCHEMKGILKFWVTFGQAYMDIVDS
jgi:hypothetical protein